MKYTYTKLILLLICALPFFMGCEKEELLQSKKKIEKQLTGDWKQMFTPSETDVTWKFQEGHFYIRQNGNLRTQGSYTVDCSATKAKVIISGLPTGFDHLNRTWQVLDLNDDIFVITDLNKGIMEYEFVKKSE